MAGALGAEVRGIDLEHLDAAGVARVRELVLEHLAVFFPDQQLSVAGHHRLGTALGEVVANSYTLPVDASYPGVTVHRSEDGYVADVWHSDGQPRPDFYTENRLNLNARGYEAWTAAVRPAIERLTSRRTP